MKKRNKRRLLLSLIMILFTGVVLSTSTYAWFTANKTVTVNSIDVNVAAANGLQVSVDGINWKTVISNSDITGASSTYASAVNQLPSDSSSLSPVSTIGNIDTNGLMEMYNGEIDSNDAGNYILKSTKTTETNGTSGHFIAFDMFFQVNDVTPVYLTPNSHVKAKDVSNGIENAARMAFVNLGNTANGSSSTDIQALKDTSNTPIIWELNYDIHTAAAVANAASNYGITTTVTGGEALPYYGVKSEITKENNVLFDAVNSGNLVLIEDNVLLNSTTDTYFSAVTPTIKTPASGIPTDAYQAVFTLQPGITKMRMYMWVEGQDVDCENNASGGSISYNLQFSVLSNGE